MEAGSKDKSANKKTSAEDEVLSLKKKGDEFFEDDEFEKALECYNRAIEMDDSNKELWIYRAWTHWELDDYEKSLPDAEKFVELCTGTEECNSYMMFNALKLITQCMVLSSPNTPDNRKKLEGIFTRAMRITEVSVDSIEWLIEFYNKWKHISNYDPHDLSFISYASEQGTFSYGFGDRQTAIERFTKAIEDDRADSSAFASRAVCFAEEANRKEELNNDVRNCIDLDFRFASFFTSKAKQFECRSQIAECFRLIKALGASIETYKRSAGKFFPKILDEQLLNESEIKRFDELNENYYTPLLWNVNQDIYPYSQSNSEAASSNNRVTAEKNERNLSGQVLSLKKKGEMFYEQKQFEYALDCYNKAIELDKSSNLELLICRVQVYFDMKKWEKCISEAHKLIALHKSQGKSSRCEPVFRAWKLIGLSALKQTGPNPISSGAFKKALKIDAPTDEIERTITYYNVARKGLGNVPASIAAFKVGRQHYLRDNSVEAIKEYTKAIKHNQVDALIYAFRAICYAEDDKYKQELISDVKESLDLDYRVIELFLITSISGYSRCPTARLRLLKALSSSEETFKQSAGRIFPKIPDNKQLNKYERKRFGELAERWRAEHLHPKHRVISMTGDAALDLGILLANLRFRPS